MKKSIRMILVAMLVTLMVAFAGQAMAYFEDGKLVRVVWERQDNRIPSGTYEVVADVGDWALKSLYTGPSVMINSPAFSLGQLGLTSWDNVYVAYFTKITDTADVWVSGAFLGNQTSNSRQWGVFNTRAGTLMGFNYQSGQPQNVNQQTNPYSFVNQYNNYGNFGGFLSPVGGTPTNPGHISLASFNQPDIQYVDQILYFYDSPNSAASGVPILVLRTYETGMTEIRPIPIPPAAILLGTGLLGLIGIRRRMKDDVRKG